MDSIFPHACLIKGLSYATLHCLAMFLYNTEKWFHITPKVKATSGQWGFSHKFWNICVDLLLIHDSFIYIYKYIYNVINIYQCFYVSNRFSNTTDFFFINYKHKQFILNQY